MIYHFTDEQVRLFNSLSFFPLKSNFIFMLYLYSTLFAYHRVPTYAKRFSCYITKFDHFDPIRQLTRQFSKRCKINFPSLRVDSAQLIKMRRIKAPITLYRIATERRDFFTGLGSCLHYATIIGGDMKSNPVCAEAV